MKKKTINLYKESDSSLIGSLNNTNEFSFDVIPNVDYKIIVSYSYNLINYEKPTNLLTDTNKIEKDVLNKNVILHAKWIEEEYTIIFDLAGHFLLRQGPWP
mgnify:CR=1 FL=1